MTDRTFAPVKSASRSSHSQHWYRPPRDTRLMGNAPTVQPLLSDGIVPPAQGHDFANLKFGRPDLRPNGGGRPLPIAFRRKMETAFAADFSDVRLHLDDKPGSIGADAFARGRHIHVAPGNYRPENRSGQRVLAHELAHIIQQRGKRTAATENGTDTVVIDPRHESEADRQADKAVSGERVADTAGKAAGASESAVKSAAGRSEPITHTIQPRITLEGGSNYRRRVRRQLQSLLPAGVHLRTDGGTGDVSLHHQPGAAANPAVTNHEGYQLVSRMINHHHNVRVTPTDTRRRGVIRGMAENPQAPSFRQNPAGWFRHHAYGFAGLFSQQYRQRQAVAAAADPQRGSDHQFFYDPNPPDQVRPVRVHDPVQNRTVQELAPHNTILAHELIHADRSQRGRMAATPTGSALWSAFNYTRGNPPGGAPHWFPGGPADQDQETEELEEMETVGLPSAPVLNPMFQQRAQRDDFLQAGRAADPNDITENMIRARLGLRRRAAYRP